jgi:hypothetical protein
MSMSVEFQLGLCTECNIEHEVFDLKVEEDTDVTIKVEEMPEAISFPPIKPEQDEVSYMTLCILLHTFHQYPEKPSVLHCLHLFVCPTTPL